MKIVLPVHHFLPRYSAGAELYTYRLARWLIAAGHQVEVVCVEQPEGAAGGLTCRYDEYQGVPVRRLGLPAPADAWRWSYDNPAIGRWFEGYLAESRPDLVHFQGAYLLSASVLIAAQAQRVPTVLTMHDYWFICPRVIMLRGDGTICAAVPEDPAACSWCVRIASRRYRLPDQITGGQLGRLSTAFTLQASRVAHGQRRERLRSAVAAVDVVIAPSHFLARMASQALGSDRIRVLRLGIDCDQLASTPQRPDDGVLRLSYVGQVAPHKGVHILAEAVARLPQEGRPIELTIYGDPDQRKEYGSRLRKLSQRDGRIKLAGRFEHSRLSEVLGRCDVVVVPSVWYENCPLTILEAHAAGRPVLASALGGMAELVDHGINGLHFRAGDVEDLARQIGRLRDEPGLLAQLRRGVTRPATVEDEMGELSQIYLSLAAGVTSRTRAVPEPTVR